MDLKNFNICNMPAWTHEIINHLEDSCWRELKRDCVAYREILEDIDELLEKHPFLSALVDGREGEKELILTLEDQKFFFEYLILDGQKRDMEKIQMYLFGYRHMAELLKLIKVI